MTAHREIVAGGKVLDLMEALGESLASDRTHIVPYGVQQAEALNQADGCTDVIASEPSFPRASASTDRVYQASYRLETRRLMLAWINTHFVALDPYPATLQDGVTIASERAVAEIERSLRDVEVSLIALCVCELLDAHTTIARAIDRFEVADGVR